MTAEPRRRLSIHLLGGFAVRDERGCAYLAHSSRLQLLLAYLLLHRHSPLGRDQIAFTFWPNVAESKARTNLRSLLYRLRKELPAADRFLHMDNQTVQWRMNSSCTLDVEIFEQEVEQATTADELTAALNGYTGDLLPDCYEDWIIAERERLRQGYLDGLSRLATLQEQQERVGAAIATAQRLLREEPLQEESYRRLMRLHALQRDRAAVESVWQQCVETMEAELDLPPSPALAEHYERFVQVASAEGPRHNLPPQPTPFFGREAELWEMDQQLADPNCRLLTLVGPGGIGKTRLALQAAQSQVVDFLDGVVFVSLVGLSTTDYLATTIADAAGIQFQGNQPPEKQLLRHLREKELLLVLDNYEHLLPNTNLVERILAEAPHVKILVTSRERLNLHGEWLQPLEGLPVPETDDENSRSNSAVQLFEQMARRVQPGFSLDDNDGSIAHICRLVEGMPLALELAAAWTRMLSCAQIAAQLRQGIELFQSSLRDLPDRHRSLRAVFAHSWQMLSPREQQIFARLSVFRGGFTLEAAEQVADASLPLLATLLDKSLLRRDQLPSGHGRFDLHELIRQYTAEKLAEHPRLAQETHLRHTTYYTGQVAKAAAQEHQATLVQTVDTEIDNIRAAWQHAVETANAQALGAAAPGLAIFYDVRALRPQAYEVLRTGVAAVEPLVAAEAAALLPPRKALGGLLATFSYFVPEVEGFKAALAMTVRATALLRPFGESRELASALLFRGSYEWRTGDAEQGRKHLQQALALGRTVDSTHVTVSALLYLGQLDLRQKALDAAAQRFEEMLVLSRKRGIDRGTSMALSSLAYTLLQMERPQAAEQHAREALAVSRKSSDDYQINYALFLLGISLYQQRNYVEAYSTFLQAYRRQEAVHEHWHGGHTWVSTLCHLGRTALARQRPSEAARWFLRALNELEAHRCWRLVGLLALGLGDLLVEQNSGQAHALFAFAAHDPLSSPATRQEAEQRLQQHTAELSPDSSGRLVAQAAQMEAGGFVGKIRSELLCDAAFLRLIEQQKEAGGTAAAALRPVGL